MIGAAIEPERSSTRHVDAALLRVLGRAARLRAREREDASPSAAPQHAGHACAGACASARAGTSAPRRMPGRGTRASAPSRHPVTTYGTIRDAPTTTTARRPLAENHASLRIAHR